MNKPIVRKMKLAELDGASYNPRKIDEDSMRGLRESIASFSLLEMPVVNIHGGKKLIVSGHQRVKALMEENITFADCLLVDFDEITEKVANVSMNNRAIQGTFDAPKAVPHLDSILAQLPKPDLARFDKLSEEVRKEADKIAARTAASASDDAPAEKVKNPVSQVGKIYTLGKHRLFCGECQVGIPKLLGKKRAVACITDPPYNVAYSTEAHGEIENDDLGDEEWLAFVDSFTDLILSMTYGPCYVFMASKEIPALVDGWEKNGGIVHRMLVWVKDSFTLSRGDYHHQYEPCLYGYRAGVTPKLPEEPKSNVLEFPKPKKNDLHPTMKPVALIDAIMRDCTEPGDLVIEPFCGSGTTLVVAENLGRVCYASELDPAHVDTIRKRWAEQVHGPGADWQALTPAVSKS